MTETKKEDYLDENDKVKVERLLRLKGVVFNKLQDLHWKLLSAKEKDKEKEEERRKEVTRLEGKLSLIENQLKVYQC